MVLIRKPVKKSEANPTVVGNAIISRTVRKWMGDPEPPPATKARGKKPKQSDVAFRNGQAVAPPGYLQSTALDREIVFGSLYTQEGMSGALRPPYDPAPMRKSIVFQFRFGSRDQRSLRHRLDPFLYDLPSFALLRYRFMGSRDDILPAETRGCQPLCCLRLVW
jgi:hypothetical protein